MYNYCKILLIVNVFSVLSCNQQGNGSAAPDAQPVTHADLAHWVSAWNSHNLDSIASLYADDAIIYQSQNPEPLTKKTMMPFFAMVLAAYPDIKFDATSITVDGGEAVSWEKVTGTMKGPFTDPITGRIVQPSGKPFEYEAAKRLEYNADHKIKEEHILLGPTAAAGKDTISSPITHADVERWLVAWNSHNLDSIDALFSDDARIYQPQNPRPLTKKTMNPFFAMVFKTYPDIKFQKEGITVDGYDAASWEDVTGTMQGAFKDPATGLTLQPTGKRFDHKGAMHLTYNPDHTIREVHIIWDQLIVLKQLGLPCN